MLAWFRRMTMLKAGRGHGVPATEAADRDAAGGGGSTGRS